VSLVTGAVRYSLLWLKGAPFSDYTIPGYVLAIVVGVQSQSQVESSYCDLFVRERTSLVRLK
jgi:hypothetical protein